MTHDWSKALLRRTKANPAPPDKQEEGPKKKWVPPAGWEQAEARAKAERVASMPLNYGSLADMDPGQIDAIERTAMVDLRRFMDRQGLTLDERTLRPHWQLVVDGYGFRMPEGYIHPEAPPEVVQQERENWKRAVEGAADSIYKAIHCMVWRRRPARLTPSDKPKRLSTFPVGWPNQSAEHPTCGPCNAVFPTDEDLRRHVEKVHPLPESDFKILGEG